MILYTESMDGAAQRHLGDRFRDYRFIFRDSPARGHHPSAAQGRGDTQSREQAPATQGLYLKIPLGILKPLQGAIKAEIVTICPC